MKRSIRDVPVSLLKVECRESGRTVMITEKTSKLTRVPVLPHEVMSAGFMGSML